jgi:hypothetical protein
MDFRAINILAMAVSRLMDEMNWVEYGGQNLNTPLVVDQEDCHKLDTLIDMMGTLSRMMDTRINFVTNEGKVIREWIESILQICRRYERELELIKELEKDSKQP